ncbi:MAG: aminoacyl-tRNA deacylase [Candidatus Woesearchaeota archaeon]
MDTYDENIQRYISENNIVLERMIFEEDVKTAEESSKYTGARPESNVKTVLFLDKDKRVYSVIARCMDKVDVKKLQATFDKKIYFMPWSEVEKYVGYPVGGVPPFGYDARFVVSSDLGDNEDVYAGGGTERSIIKISIKELKRIIRPDVLDIVKR